MNKTALVTGSASGIGRATARLFRKYGWCVIGIDRKDVRTHTDFFLHVDIAQPDAARLIKSYFAKNRLGRLDALVNNAAVQLTKSFENISRSEWQQSFAVNAEAPFFLAQQLLPELRKAKGSIINVASIHAHLTKKHFSLYAATKGALLALTRGLAIELAPQVRVNAVLPAATKTRMLLSGFTKNPAGHQRLGDCHPMQRIAKPEEIAEIIYFLASDKSGFITGSAFSIDGGIGACLLDPAAYENNGCCS